jgi:lipoate-protein ligase B
MAWAVTFARPGPYAEGLRIQERLHAARVADAIPDTVLLLQHTPVITLGRRGRTQHLLAREDALRARGIDLYEASRGGDVTYHGPGQWVLYPILRLARAGGSHNYLHQLEETAIRTAAAFGVSAFRRSGKSGAWTEAGKIAAIGFKIQRWVTLHGMSFNVRGPLEGFGLIVPCGLVGDPVASLETLLAGSAPPMDEAGRCLLAAFAAVTGLDLDVHAADGPLPEPLRTHLQ